jgi:bacteriorhodopsin
MRGTDSTTAPPCHLSRAHSRTRSRSPSPILPLAQLVGTLGLLAGTTISELFFTTAFSLLVTGGLFAAAISSGANATWPIFAFAVVAAVPIVYQVLVTWAARAAAGPKATKAVYTVLSYLGFALAIG